MLYLPTTWHMHVYMRYDILSCCGSLNAPRAVVHHTRAVWACVCDCDHTLTYWVHVFVYHAG
jgi:hypothetical protein